MNKPLVSILIMAYNQEAYIAGCLDSALAQQGNFNFELVLAEDASTDGTAQICEAYRQRHPDKIVLLKNQRNRGVVQNYFTALEQCRGEFIADCGGDDYWPDPLRLQKQLDILMQHPELSMVYGQWKNFRQAEGSFEKPANLPDHQVYNPNDFGQSAAARFLNRASKPEIVLSTACYRKSFISDALRAYPEMFIDQAYPTEDISVITALLMRGPAWYLPECFLVYRVLENSVSHSASQNRYYRFACSSFKQSLDWARHIGLSLRDILPYLESRYRDYLHYAFLEGDKALAAELRKTVRKQGYRPACKNELKYYWTQCSRKRPD